MEIGTIELVDAIIHESIFLWILNNIFFILRANNNTNILETNKTYISGINKTNNSPYALDSTSSLIFINAFKKLSVNIFFLKIYSDYHIL